MAPTALRRGARVCFCSLQPGRARGHARPYTTEQAGHWQPRRWAAAGPSVSCLDLEDCRADSLALRLPTPASLVGLYQRARLALDMQHRHRDPLLAPFPTSILMASFAFYQLLP